MSATDLAPWALGVCSWSLQVKSIPELKDLLDHLGVNVVQIACGDPHHASWDEGDAMPQAALASGIVMTGAMLGFPGEDYTTPRTIKETGGFGNPATRAERLERLRWALERTQALGLRDLTLHAGFIPEPDDPGRGAMLDTLGQAGRLAEEAGITLAFETGQETADLLRRTLDELKAPNLKVNFDPANMLLYDMGDPLRAVEILGPDIRSVHIKDARRTKVPGEWGEEVPLGEGEVNIPQFLRSLERVGFDGPLIVEREVGDQAGRLAMSPWDWNDCDSGAKVDGSTPSGPTRKGEGEAPGRRLVGCSRAPEGGPAMHPGAQRAPYAMLPRLLVRPLRRARPAPARGRPLPEASAHDRIDHLGQLATGLGQRIEIVLTRAAGLDQPAVAQQCQVVADGRLALRAEVGAELSDVSLFLAEQHEDLQAGRVRHLLEQLGDATDLGRGPGAGGGSLR